MSRITGFGDSTISRLSFGAIELYGERFIGRYCCYYG